MTNLVEQLLAQALIPPDPLNYLERQQMGDAELFSGLFAGRAVFDHAEKVWYLWNGQVWEPDRTRAVIRLAGNELGAAYLDAAETARRTGDRERSDMHMKRARLLLDLRRIRDVLELASSQPGIALRGPEWDTPPMLLPVQNGIIDLTTGVFRSAFPQDHVRSYAPTAWYGLDYRAPRWEQALLDIFGADAEMVSFMQRLLGYAITGDPREQILPIFWGQGANGKSTVMSVISSVLGSAFCFQTQADSLMDLRESDGNAPRPFVHALRNKRIAWASESKEGRRLNAGLVKQLTGDREITARTLYREPTTFRQTHLIVLVTNHCPRLPDGDDQALWRRILRIPFTESFIDRPTDSHQHPRDKQLVEALLEEGPGVLAWLVAGCLAWQRDGLNPPRAVTQSTESYRQDEDLIGQFIRERLQLGEGLEAPAGAVYKEYQVWCDESATRKASSRAVGQVLTRRFGPAVSKWTGHRNQRVYLGIGLLASSATHTSQTSQFGQGNLP